MKKIHIYKIKYVDIKAFQWVLDIPNYSTLFFSSWDACINALITLGFIK